MRLRQSEEEREAAVVLVAAVADPGSPLGRTLERALGEGVPARFVRAAVEHGLPGLVARRLAGVGGNDRVVAALTRHRHGALVRHLATLADLRAITTVLDGLAAPWAVVKGPILAGRAYARPDMRSYSDLDLLIHPAAFGDALDRLEAAGAQLVDRNWGLISSTMRGELSLTWEGRTGIDLHWHLLNDRRLREVFSVDVRDVLERVRAVEVDGDLLPTLDAVDTVWHLCLHACLAGADRLVWLRDVVSSLQLDDVAPAAVIARGDATGTALPTSAVLGRAMSLLAGSTTPRRPWVRALELGDTFRLHEPRRHVYAALRRTLPQSVGALASTLGGDAIGSRRPPLQLSDLHRPADEHDRRAFLEAVKRSR